MPDDDPAARARSRIGTTLEGKYRLDALIGVGGMAAVYRATHRNRAELAVKVLHPELSLKAETRARFLREGYAANSVKHPGVVLVVDDDVAEDGAAFLVMELLDGETVEQLSVAYGNKLPASIAVSVVHQLLDVLAAAHAAGVVHRDIKPANLFLTRDGTLKVLDFGIARVLESTDLGALATGTGIPIGTPAFMAPEQALARSREIDARTDVWAAGATLFTLLSGVTVHDTPTSAEALVNAATRAARSLAAVAPDVPAALVAVVDKALAFERADRWPSARAMESALVDAFVAVSGAPPSRASLTGLFPPRGDGSSPTSTGTARSGASSDASAPWGRRPTPELSSAPTLAAGAPGSPTGPGAAARPRPGASRWIPAAVAALGIAAAALWIRHRGRPEPTPPLAAAAGGAIAPDAPPLVLVFGFDNRTSDPVLDGTIDLLLGGALKRSPKLYPLVGPSLRALVAEKVPEAAGRDDDVGRLLAERERRPVTLVHGYIAQEGAGFTISVSAKDGASGSKLAETALFAPSIEAIASTTADLACALRTWLHDEPCDDASRGKTGLSASMDANHEFSVGRGAFNNGNNAEAEPHFVRAVAIDPDFTLAQLSLGLLLWNTGRASLGLPHLDIALARQDQLSLRERLVVAATEHVMKDEFDGAIEAYEEQLRRWPADTTPRGNLAASLFGAGRIADAVAMAERTLAEHPRNVIVWGELAELHVLTGALAEASRESHMVLANFSKPPSVTQAAGAAAELLLGRRAAALELAATLAGSDPVARDALDADIAMFEGRLDDARAILERIIAAEEAKKAEAEPLLATLAEVFDRRGDAERARGAATRAARSDDLVTLVRAGRVLARARRPAEAEGVARRILTHTGQRAPLFARIVRAEDLLARHAPKDAIALLGDVGSGAGSSFARLVLAEAELEAGSTEEALRRLEAALAHPGALAFAFYDEATTLRYLPGAAYSIARAKDLLHRSDAADAYRAFLAMEPSAQGDPLVTAARAR